MEQVRVNTGGPIQLGQSNDGTTNGSAPTNSHFDVVQARTGGFTGGAIDIVESKIGGARGGPIEIVEGDSASDAPIPISSPPGPRTNDSKCPTCANGDQSAVYAIGRIEARFPRPSIEKEFAQVVGRSETGGKTDQQVFHEVLSKRENRYLARQLCWVLTVQGLETYLLYPKDPADYDLLVQAIRPSPGPWDLDVVIGMRGPIAPAHACNGLMVPVVFFDQLYSFDRDILVRAIPRPQNLAQEQFEPAAAEMFERIMQLTDNAGATDDHRALNYLAVRYPAVYALTADNYARSASLRDVSVKPSRLNGTRKVLDVVFSYSHRQTDVVDKYFTRVDVTEEFPFLVTKLAPYYDR